MQNCNSGWPKGKPRKRDWRDQEREFKSFRDPKLEVSLAEVTCLSQEELPENEELGQLES